MESAITYRASLSAKRANNADADTSRVLWNTIKEANLSIANTIWPISRIAKEDRRNEDKDATADDLDNR